MRGVSKITGKSERKIKLKILFYNPNDNDEFERLLRLVIIEKIKSSKDYPLIIQ